MTDPAPSPQPVPPQPRRYLTVPVAIVIAGFLIAMAIFLRPASPSVPASPSNFVKLGRDYAVVLTTSYADSLDLAGNDISAGKPVAEAQKNMQESWTRARVEAFTATITPALNKMNPEGAEPSTPEQRQQLSAAFHSLAQGVRSADTNSRSNWLGR